MPTSARITQSILSVLYFVAKIQYVRSDHIVKFLERAKSSTITIELITGNFVGDSKLFEGADRRLSEIFFDHEMLETDPESSQHLKRLYTIIFRETTTEERSIYGPEPQGYQVLKTNTKMKRNSKT